ncbi:MAG TPA: ATP-binding protein [Candidatus Dormibacteraeota bacterium]
MIWRRWREARATPVAPEPDEPFADLLEEAPVMAMLVDRENRVLAANRAARAYFGIDLERLPLHVAEVTREARLDELLRQGRPDGEARLTHTQRVVISKLVPGPRSGLTLVFLTDVTELRRLQTVRQEFVANLSHELKTPLTALRLAAESLEGHPPEDARHRFTERIVIEADRLAAIVDNLRQLAEIEAGRALVESSPVEVEAVLREVTQRAGGRPVELTVSEGLVVEADRAKLAQALGNLLDNAAKFSPPGTPIEVSAEPAGGEVRITVRDHGNGISPEHWDRVFERFYKVDPARNREVPGTGLGLAIVKHLVLLQGGRVWTEAAPGGGQLFGMALPAALTSP